MRLRKPGISALPTLYRAGKHDHILFWRAEIEDGTGRWRAVSGVVGGKEKVGFWSDCEPMNVGRANERSADSQARFTASAKWEKLLKRGGYFKRIADIGQTQFTAPMLAHVYDKKNPPVFPQFVQPKFNGVRCVANLDGLFTRNGEPIVSAPHIWEDINGLFGDDPNLVLDGELYNHELSELLNRMVSLVRKKNPTPEELAESKKLVQFHVYDTFAFDGGHSTAFKNRHNLVADYVEHTQFCYPVETIKVYNMEEVDEHFKRYIISGYEGLMLRDPEAVYVNDRTVGLLKYKPRYSDDFIIDKIEEGNGKRKGMAGAIHIRIPARTYEGPGKGYVVKNATTCKINVRWPDDRKRYILENRERLEGTLLTGSYAYITEYGKLFHGYIEHLWESKTRV